MLKAAQNMNGECLAQGTGPGRHSAQATWHGRRDVGGQGEMPMQFKCMDECAGCMCRHRAVRCCSCKVGAIWAWLGLT